MAKRRRSLTAELVAISRAIAREGDASLDPHAKELVSPILRAALNVYESASPLVREVSRRALDLGTLGAVEHVAGRTRAIDDACREAYKQGIRTFVILGAGLDARAHRLSTELAGAKFFEVDAPPTQEVKRARTGDLGATIVYVPVVFGVDALRDRLVESGFDGSEPCAWVWEGVTMYLTTTALIATLRDIESLSKPGSVLAATYFTRRDAETAFIKLARGVLRVVGEPVEGVYSSVELSRILESHGFSVIADEADEDWGPRYNQPRSLLTALDRERLAVARRT